MIASLAGSAALCLYGFGAYRIWRSLRGNAPAVEPSAVEPGVAEPGATAKGGFGGRTAVISVAAALHAASVYFTLVAEGGIDLSLFVAASLITWVVVVALLATMRWQPFESLAVIVLPVAALTIAGSLLLPRTAPLRTDLSDGLLLHIVLSISAYAVLTMAAVICALILLLERRLRRHEAIGIATALPPLQTMEALLFRLLWIGVALLSVTIISGFVFLEDMFAQQVVHHTVLALASWGFYASMLTGHSIFGWRGKTTVRTTLAAFGFLALAYFGSKFVLEFILGASP